VKVLGILKIVAVSSLSAGCAPAVGSVQLQPEVASVLQVGQSASLSVPSDRDFSIGSAGAALVLTRQEQHGASTIYVYRAVQAGDQTFVATPKAPGADGCVSCVTMHYFAKVIP
jgi:hypothetical protein